MFLKFYLCIFCFQKCRLKEEPLTFGALCVLKHLLPRFFFPLSEIGDIIPSLIGSVFILTSILQIV